MIDKFEFGDAKQLRKSLLVTSFIGIVFENLIKHSTGNIEFLGFKIPVSDANIIPTLIGYLIIYFMVALIIRYSDEKFRKRHKEYMDYLKIKNSYFFLLLGFVYQALAFLQ